VKSAGFEGFVFHELRHTSAALAIEQGAHPMAIKERLGHASITTTLDRYGGLFPSLDRQLADELDLVRASSIAS
jgi:integrase